MAAANGGDEVRGKDVSPVRERAFVTTETPPLTDVRDLIRDVMAGIDELEETIIDVRRLARGDIEQLGLKDHDELARRLKGIAVAVAAATGAAASVLSDEVVAALAAATG